MPIPMPPPAPGGLIGYGNDYRAENCFSYGAVSAAAGTAGGLIGRDSSRSTNVRENLYYRADSCGTAVGGKAEASGTAARTTAEFAGLSFLRQLDKNGCFMLENGAYPELSASARCAHLETELRDARAATCTEAGYTGDTVCKACGTEITHGARPSRLRDISTATARAQCAARRTRAGSGTERPWNDPFRDVRASDWFYFGVKFAYQHGLFQGTAADMFSPDEPMTRAMLVTVLWRMDGKPGAAGGVVLRMCRAVSGIRRPSRGRPKTASSTASAAGNSSRTAMSRANRSPRSCIAMQACAAFRPGGARGPRQLPGRRSRQRLGL